MINYETILSSYDNKLTLMQWLNKVELALKNASLSSVSISQPTTTTAVLTFHFADGTSLDSPSLVLPQGPQGEQGPTGATGATGAQGPQGPQGPQGEQGEKGEDGTSVRILASAEACTHLGDGYIDASGHLQVLTNLSPRTFTDAGLIRGPQGPQGPQGEQGPTGATGATGAQGPQGEQGPQGPAGANGTNGTNGTDGADGADGVSVTNVAVTQTNHLIVTLSNNTTIDAGEIQVSGGGSGIDTSGLFTITAPVMYGFAFNAIDVDSSDPNLHPTLELAHANIKCSMIIIDNLGGLTINNLTGDLYSYDNVQITKNNISSYFGKLLILKSNVVITGGF